MRFMQNVGLSSFFSSPCCVFFSVCSCPPCWIVASCLCRVPPRLLYLFLSCCFAFAQLEFVFLFFSSQTIVCIPLLLPNVLSALWLLPHFGNGAQRGLLAVGPTQGHTLLGSKQESVREQRSSANDSTADANVTPRLRPHVANAHLCRTITRIRATGSQFTRM